MKKNALNMQDDQEIDALIDQEISKKFDKIMKIFDNISDEDIDKIYETIDESIKIEAEKQTREMILSIADKFTFDESVDFEMILKKK